MAFFKAAARRGRRRSVAVTTQQVEVLELRTLLTTPSIESVTASISGDGSTITIDGVTSVPSTGETTFVEIDLLADGSIDQVVYADSSGQFQYSFASSGYEGPIPIHLRAVNSLPNGLFEVSAWQYLSVFGNGDPGSGNPGNGGGNNPSIPGTNLPPVLSSVATFELPDGVWMISGHVTDESPMSVSLSFGSLYVTASVDADGHFSAFVSDEPIVGMVYTAVATDNAGQASDPFDFIFS